MSRTKPFPAPDSHGVDDATVRRIRAAAMAEAVLDAELDRLDAHHLAAAVRTVTIPGPDDLDQDDIVRDLVIHYASHPVPEPTNACALLHDSADPDERVMVVVEVEDHDPNMDIGAQDHDRLRSMRLDRRQLAEIRHMAATLVRLRARRERLEDLGVETAADAPASSYDIPLHHLAMLKALKIKPDTALRLARQWREWRGLPSHRQWNHAYARGMEKLCAVPGGDGIQVVGVEHAQLGLRGTATINGGRISVAEDYVDIHGISLGPVESLAAIGAPLGRIAPFLAKGVFAEVASLPVASVHNFGANLMVKIAAPVVNLA